jgi:hypothetical protein
VAAMFDCALHQVVGGIDDAVELLVAEIAD